MKRVFLISLILFLIAGCYKDDVDLAALTTNTFDPDYTGPAYIEVESSSLEQIAGSPTVYNHVLEVHVKSEVFTSPTLYNLRVREQGTGQVTDLTTIGNDDFVYRNVDIAPGVEYCYELSLVVGYSETRKEGFCAIAQ